MCSFRLVPERKTGKEIPESSRIEFLERFSELLERQHLRAIYLWAIYLCWEQKSWEPGFWEVMDSFVLVAYASLAASRTLLQRLLASLNFTLDSEDLSFWYKVTSMNYGSRTSSWKPWTWVRLDLILLMRNIYINSNLNPQNSPVAESLSVKISSHGTSLKWSRRLFKSVGE